MSKSEYTRTLHFAVNLICFAFASLNEDSTHNSMILFEFSGSIYRPKYFSDGHIKLYIFSAVYPEIETRILFVVSLLLFESLF